MTDAKTDTSFNALLIYAAIALLCLAGAWTFFEYRDSTASTTTAAPQRAPEPAAAPNNDIAPILNERLDASLNKARLAAEANMLTDPAGENALYFYGLVLNQDHSHTEANEEIDAILETLRARAEELLGAGEYAAAHRLAEQVAYLRPEHVLVTDTADALREVQTERLAEAVAEATRGDRDAALQSLDEAGILPGVDPAALAAARADVDSQLAEFAANETQRLAAERQAQAAAARALEVPSWLVSGRAALAEGRLIAPEGDNALAYLNQGDGDKADQFQAQLMPALLNGSQRAAGDGDLDAAAALLEAASVLEPDSPQLDTVATAIKVARVQALAATPISPRDLTRRNRVAPVYPRSAERKRIGGWVDMAFTVTTAGNTTDIEILNSEPPEVFDQAVVQAASQWLFEPREIEEIPVDQRVMTRIVFEIPD
ncbi:MAG: energy transducer TonB [Pseudomonadota bacterium]